jgi:hypothetical protein
MPLIVQLDIVNRIGYLQAPGSNKRPEHTTVVVYDVSLFQELPGRSKQEKYNTAQWHQKPCPMVMAETP